MANTQSDKQAVLFIQGAGDGAYEEDAKMANALQTALGAAYTVHYPRMPGDSATDMEWAMQVGKEIDERGDDVLVVAHSFGGAALLKNLTENNVEQKIRGIFLIAAPFWGGDKGWQYEGFTIVDDFPSRLPVGTPIYLYHNADDDVVPFAHLALYATKLPQAKIHAGTSGGHQFGNDLTQVAQDITHLA